MRVNKLLRHTQENYLYILELDLTPDILEAFKGIHYVLLQGSNDRAKSLAQKLAYQFLGINYNYFEPKDIAPTSRYQVYRIGNILSVSHGMGSTSIITLLQEITKALYYAGSRSVQYIRIGTSGGIGVAPGSVIITQEAFMPDLKPYFPLPSLDKNIHIPTKFDLNLARSIKNAQPNDLPFAVIEANTIAADDFYLGQGRFDGAIAPKQDLAFRTEYFKKVRQLDILNFEMESTAMAAFCHEVQIPATMAAVTLLNRFNTDQISSSPEQLAEFSNHAQQVALNYLKTQNRGI